MEALNDKAQSGRARLLKTKRLRGAGRGKTAKLPYVAECGALIEIVGKL
jgi:hypothetical protein